MPLTLLIAVILTVAVHAQRSSAAFQGISGLGAHSGFGESPSLSSGFFSQRGVANEGFFPQPGFANRIVPNRSHRHHHRRDGISSPYLVPDDPFWYEPPDSEEVIESAAPVIEQRHEGQSLIREKPVPKSKIIEIPVARSTARKPLPPTIFILMSGERLESRQFLLTASDLSIKVDRYTRTIPLELLNLDPTIAANRERGIDLRIPADRSEISLRF